MAPKPAFHFQQSQPITTGLRIICEHYPTKTCLRELLQNADDAGASEIEYVLDTKSYTKGPFLHDALIEYQGPALLVRNNRVFTEDDFISLCSVGDSRKRYDASKTGKFGQGFNSVYHWTDGPWIYSRNVLLMLDPHEHWSNETEKPGGPAWDVIAHGDCIEMQNHLKTFRALDLDMSQELDQTIIRIPLRTESQAAISKIVKRETTTDDIKKALEQFGDEMKEGGLIFLKFIRKITIRIDVDVLATIEIVGHGPQSLKARDGIPTDFKRLYTPGLVLEKRDHISKSFRLDFVYSAGTSSSTESYLIHHTMRRSSGDEELDIWARKEKLFPWTAIAAPLHDTKGSFHGRLYSTLSLPILTTHPVHIHGLWSIAPDRGRLSSSGQSFSPEDRWNQFMFKCCVPATWTSVLVHRNQISWEKEAFSLWPQIMSKQTDIWGMLDDWVIDKIISEKAPVWNTKIGCVAIDRGFFSAGGATSEVYEMYSSALAQIKMPIVFLETPFFEKAKQRAKLLSMELPIIEPACVRDYIRRHPSFLSDNTSPKVLEYCLLDTFNSKDGNQRNIYNDMCGLRLWPLLSSPTLSNLQNLVLPRNLEEMELFKSSCAHKIIDLGRLTSPVRGLLRNDIAFVPGMRFRVLSDLQKDWPQIYPVGRGSQNSNALMKRPLEFDSVLRSIWSWICERQRDGERRHLSVLDDLWLIPVNKQYIRLYSPKIQAPPMLIVTKNEQLYQIMVEIALKNNGLAATLLDTESIPLKAVQLLREQVSTNSQFGGACVKHLQSFGTWLAASRKSLAELSDQHKVLVLQHLEYLVRSQDPSIGNSVGKLKSDMRTLPLFSKIRSAAPYTSRTITRCNLDGCGMAIEAPPGLPPLPDIPGISLYDLTDASERYLVEYFDLLTKIPLETLLEQHLLPWVTTAGVEDKPKENLINFVFQHDKSRLWARMIAKFSIIPLALHNGRTRYGRLADVVHPSSLISELYFDSENVFPDRAFFEEHEIVLTALGLKRELACSEVVGRIQYFSRCAVGELARRVGLLLSLPIPRELAQDQSMIHKIRTSKWIPGEPPGGGPLCLQAPNDCRGADMSACIDFVMGTTQFSVEEDWQKILGWDKPIEHLVLIRQLDFCLERSLHDKVNEVLRRLQPTAYAKLLRKSCVLGKVGKIYRYPQNTFLPGSRLTQYPMAPLLDEVDSLFEEKHSKLIKALGIRDEPSLEDIIHVQKTIQDLCQVLDASNLGVIISSLQIAICLHDSDELTDMLVPDTHGILRSLSDIVHGDHKVSGGVSDFNFVHPAVSPKVIQALGVENALARATRLDIAFEDEDEDEYTPREKLTTVISDTLGRYSIESTFNEFLANAEDCGATKISWVLDGCHDGSHNSTALLNPDLAAFQGPALFVHNDGVFSDKDFAGFKDIGLGSKADDAHSTGMFGRGALTMYHFTDLPMIISGGSFLILDPQQNLLPRNNSSWKRKVGVRLSLSRALRICPDQMAPFHKLCGYSKNLEYYQGTLFRFPFRLSGKTELKENGTLVDATHAKNLLNNYYNDAKVALLFLESIKTIDFSIRGQEQGAGQWRVSKEVSEGKVFRLVKITNQQGKGKLQIKIWRVGLKNIYDCPSDIVKPGRGAGKITNCGIAACVSDPTALQNIFCTLPTPLSSQIPVALHGSFAMTSDRRSIEFDGDSIVPKWNKWLLTTCIPKLYLEFLEDLTPNEGEASFDFWPARTAPSSITNLSDVVTDSFWKLVQKSNLPLFPLVDTVHILKLPGSMATRPEGTTRKLYKTTSLKTAQFEFLDPKTSIILRPLFLKICPSLVCIPLRLWEEMREMKASQSINELDCNYLCDLFREETTFQYLADFLDHQTEENRSQAMELLLELLVPIEDEDPDTLKHLDGCRVLPLLDGSLGLLTLKSRRNVEWSFVASDAEHELFYFASRSFVKTQLFRHPERTGPNPIDRIIKAPLNIRPLGLGDIGAFLAKPDSPIASPKSLHTNQPSSKDAWVAKLWRYLNQEFRKLTPTSSTSGDLMSGFGLQDLPIYRAKSNGKWEYFSPHQFETGPYVIETLNTKYRSLYAEVPNLKLVDRSCFLFSVEDLTSASSFLRFIRALKSIELQTMEPIFDYLGKTLTTKSRTFLRDRMLDEVNANSLEKDVIDILRHLPVWPSYGRETVSGGRIKYTSAAEGRFCKDEALLMPWVKSLDTFVDPDIVKAAQNSLSDLKVATLSIGEVWNHVIANYPTSLISVKPADYREFVRFIFEHDISPTINIAPDGNGKLCEASSLYDHEDAIFSAAFREQRLTKFLHPDLQELRPIWISIGLRTRTAFGIMKPEACLDCALAIVERKGNKSSPEFQQDAGKIANYLITHHDWPETVRTRLSRVEIFRVREDVSGQKDFRQDRMRAVAAERSHCSIREVGRHCDERIVWSQVPFLHNPLSDQILIDNLPDKGTPCAEMVFFHLQYLVNILDDVNQVEVSDYLRDLQATYAYLQQELRTAVLIPGIQEEEVWVNLDTTDLEKVTILDIRFALTKARLLCMNSPVDPLPIRIARKFLIPYEKLLQALGCYSVIEPRKPKRASTESDLIPMHHALTRIRDFRDQHQFVDVIFEAEGRQKPAHKIFMVAVSEYCKGQFSGLWGKLLGTPAKIQIDDMRYETLSRMVDFAYSGEVDWPPLPGCTENEEIAAQLDEFLDLLQGANRWLLTRLKEITEDYIIRYADRYVRPDNVTELKPIVSEFRADSLVKYCDDYIERNSGLVAHCNSILSDSDENAF